ncbi:hypothetical protein H311_02021 [Anncaliia algerae PRA109]|nr:hypothetical protein H311_02021 [Anncaliia algerae PRA109]
MDTAGTAELVTASFILLEFQFVAAHFLTNTSFRQLIYFHIVLLEPE